MTTAVRFALLGLGPGAAYAIAALGIVVVYRGSGVVNFAHVGIAIVGAFTYAQAQQAGWPAAAAVLLGLSCSGVTGLLIHVAVMQRMQRASPLTRVVATLGVLSILVSAAQLKYGSGVQLVPSVLPTTSVVVLGTVIGVNVLWLLGLSGVLGILLWGLYRFTRFGQLTTAVSQSHRAVATLGRSPQQIAMVNWVIGAVLAGAAGILLAPVVGLSVSQLSLLLTPALAAALVGSLASFSLTWLGAVAIGIGQSEITRYVSAPGWSSALPILVIIVVLLLRGRRLPGRGDRQDRLPLVGTGRMRPPLIVAAIVVPVVLLSVLNAQWVGAITVSIITAVICLSLTVVTGYAGQLSVAQFAFAGIAALAAARSSAVWGLPFWVALVFAIFVTIAVGLICSLAALRVRGVTLGIVTLGIATVVEQGVMGNPAYTGGLSGTTVNPPSIVGFSLNAVAHPSRYGLLCLAILVLIAWIVSNVRRGVTGRRLLAVRGNERAAASLGLSVTSLKAYAFALAAALAAVGGVLLAFQTPDVVFSGYTAQQSINVLGVGVIGGLGFIGGALVGAIGGGGGPITYALSELGVSIYWLGLAIGVIMVITLAVAPDGMFWAQAQAMRRALRRLGYNGRPDGKAPAATAPARADMRRATPHTLTASGLEVSFGGTRALTDVSLEVRPGEVLGVIGPNGAGKTTLIDVLSGLTRSDRGSVFLDRIELTRLSAHERARRGIARSYQSLELFEDLTVLENVRVASEGNRQLAWLTDLVTPRDPELAPAAVIAMHEFDMNRVSNRKPQELPYGQRRLLAIARALAAEPSVLLLDEPAAGLDEREREELGSLLRRLAADWGVAVLLVEHDVSLIARTCDRVLALDLGRIIAGGSTKDVLSDPAVVRAYLGGPEPTPAPPRRMAAEPATVDSA